MKRKLEKLLDRMKEESQKEQLHIKYKNIS